MKLIDKGPQLSGDSRISTFKGTNMPAWLKGNSLKAFDINAAVFTFMVGFANRGSAEYTSWPSHQT